MSTGVIQKKVIVLLGYMGVGKSSIARPLAAFLNWKFLDLDIEISRREGEKISDIFKKKGSSYFRKVEAVLLQEILESKDHTVLALGGGTPCYGENMKLIQQKSLSIYLKMSPEALASRLFLQRKNRPLIANISSKEKLIEYIAIHLLERQNFYLKANKIFEMKEEDNLKDSYHKIYQLVKYHVNKNTK